MHRIPLRRHSGADRRPRRRTLPPVTCALCAERPVCDTLCAAVKRRLPSAWPAPQAHVVAAAFSENIMGARRPSELSSSLYRRLDRMVERRPGLLAEFDRQCCRLCWGLGLDKAAAARSLGVHRSRVRRALQRAVKALIERWTERHGASPDKAANEA